MILIRDVIAKPHLELLLVGLDMNVARTLTGGAQHQRIDETHCGLLAGLVGVISRLIVRA
jgi:hypothetical protein